MATRDVRATGARRGSVMVYATVGMAVMVGVSILVVDGARMRLARAELQDAVDASARYAAGAMRSTSTNGTSAAAANAAASLAQNKIDGSAIAFDPSTGVTIGTWVAATRTFVPSTLALGANAVKVEASMALGSGGRPSLLGSLLGRGATVRATSIAMVNDLSSTTTASSQGNPWLAGMPAGSVCTSFQTKTQNWDYAGTALNPLQSPSSISISALGITPGTSIIFDAVTGASDFTGKQATGDADGDATKLNTLGSPNHNDFTYFNTPVNGMSNIKAPINSMMAVFLSDDQPDLTAAPASLDFGTAASRDFTSLAPQLKQVFFVGDGRNSSGEAQRFVVPPGATRVFIGSMDGWQWNNNKGSFTSTIHASKKITTVR